jgi:hypothetical protein
LLALGGFYENDCIYGEDSYLWLQVALNYTVYFHTVALVWYHTEVSELGLGRKTSHPVWPKVFDEEALYKNCAEDYKGLLRHCLDYYALLAVWRSVDAGDISTLHQLLKRYPTTNTFRYHYLKAKLKFRFPRLYELCKKLGNQIIIS